MANPGGDYPGRQIFLGGLKSGHPAFVYFVSGRSKASQSRYATPFDESERAVRIKPTDTKEPFDPFRHYQAVRIELETGLLLVSNSQAPNDMLVESYRFIPAGEINPYNYRLHPRYMKSVLELAGSEHDSIEKPTPRIAGMVLNSGGEHGN